MRHAGLAVFLHIAWGTWDRLPLITEAVKEEIYHAIGAECDKLNVEVIEIGGIEDHVHLLVSIPSTVMIAELMKQVKGVSAHLMTHVITSGKFFKWQGAYGAVSVAPDQLHAVCEYIKHQREHHTAQTLLLHWEPLPDNPMLSVSSDAITSPASPVVTVQHGPTWPDEED